MNDLKKLDKELERTLKQALNNLDMNGDIVVNEDNFNRSHIEKLCEFGYLKMQTDISTFDGWQWFVRATYDGLNYQKFKTKWRKDRIIDGIRSVVHILLSWAEFIAYIFN